MVFLIYGIGSPLFALFLLVLPIYEFLTGHFRTDPRLLVWFPIFLVILFIFQRVAWGGISWYWHRRLVTIDLKAVEAGRAQQPQSTNLSQ